MVKCMLCELLFWYMLLNVGPCYCARCFLCYYVVLVSHTLFVGSPVRIRPGILFFVVVA